jgi:hypothetical protein
MVCACKCWPVGHFPLMILPLAAWTAGEGIHTKMPGKPARMKAV